MKRVLLLALSLVSLALMTPVCAEEKMNKISAEDFAAGMEGLNVDETKHRPIFILPRPFPVYGGYGGYGYGGGYGGYGYGGGYGGYGGGYGGYGYGHHGPFYG
uniref:Uncharacterized protein n=1 Tax=Daphnia galeata TaxID=27404 RepID=A0A8J2RE86_9CRUS|nr:unnamed protein product [Daphnia galeata]